MQALVWLPLLLGCAWCVATNSFEPIWLAFGLIVLAGSYATLWHSLRPRGTPADLATLARFVALLVALAWTGLAGAVTWPLWTLWLVVVTSDLADGWLARRHGASAEGGILDMETDQLTTLSLSVVAAGVTGAGVWTLILPGLKYAFVLALAWRAVDAYQAKPVAGDNLRGKRICAAVMTLLLVCVLPDAPFVPGLVRSGASLLAVGLLGYSFSADAVFLLRAARRPSTLG